MTRFRATLQPITIVQRLSEAKSKRSQAKVIRDAWESDSEEFFLGLEMALDPRANYHTVSVPEIQDTEDGDPGTFTFNDFCRLARNLKDGEIGGETAKRAIVAAALKANISEWNLWYRRILLKSLADILPMDVIQSTLSELTNR